MTATVNMLKGVGTAYPQGGVDLAPLNVLGRLRGGAARRWGNFRVLTGPGVLQKVGVHMVARAGDSPFPSARSLGIWAGTGR